MPQVTPQIIEQVKSWLVQGYSEQQISQTLKQQGFTDSQVNEILNSAQFSTGSSSNLSEEIQNYIEATVDALIEEKWSELVKTLDDVKKWKDELTNKMLELDTKIQDLKENFKNLQDSVIGKIGEYDDHLVKIGSNVKAIEKVFQKIIPLFVENVNELDRIVEKLKQTTEEE